MGAKIKRDTNKIPELIDKLNELGKYQIHIGIFGKDDSFVLMKANVNEFGCTIESKNGKRLAIPLNKKARGKSPREFKDLFPLRTKEGKLYLVRNKGKTEIEFMYWLATKVVIPERSFIRGGFDANADKFSNKAVKDLKHVVNGDLSVKSYFDLVGEYMVGELKKYLTNLKDPPNSFATSSAKGKSNPLVDTGQLRKHITFKVVKK